MAQETSSKPGAETPRKASGETDANLPVVVEKAKGGPSTIAGSFSQGARRVEASGPIGSPG